jgi:hypothetical protein
MATKPKHKTTRKSGHKAPAVPPTDASAAPVFSQPVYTPDPTEFIVAHPSDNAAYAIIDKLNREHKIRPLPFPTARGGTEPVLTLAQTLGLSGTKTEAAIKASGLIVFHAVGDTGNTKSVDPQNLVSDKMVADFDDGQARQTPQFFFHLGDVIYNFGEAQYYYDQFYDPYRDYPDPIVALAGNHDGMVAPDTNAITLDAFLRNFCADPAAGFAVTAEAGGLNRTAQIQPGVYFTFEAPFVRIIALYSNTLEDPGVISSQAGTFPELADVQLDFLHAALTRVKAEKYAGALILAHHHPSYTAGNNHGWSVDMTSEIDSICSAVGVWPHAVLSAHAHNYQRFTRHNGGRQTPYIIAGNGGHGLARLTKSTTGPLRTPMVVQDGADQVVLENYDDQDYGYLRILVDPTQLRIEYHPASDANLQKTPDDSVTVDLATRTLTVYTLPPGGSATTLPSTEGKLSPLANADAPPPAAAKGHKSPTAKRR